MNKKMKQELIEAIIKKNSLKMIEDIVVAFGIKKSDINQDFLEPMAKAMFKTEKAIKKALKNK